MLLVYKLAYTNWCKKLENWLKPWHMGTHLRVLSKSYPKNIYITGFRFFFYIFALNKSSLSSLRVNQGCPRSKCLSPGSLPISYVCAVTQNLDSCWKVTFPTCHSLGRIRSVTFYTPESGLRHCHWPLAVSHHCSGWNPSWGMWESFQWLGGEPVKFAGHSHFLHI